MYFWRENKISEFRSCSCLNAMRLLCASIIFRKMFNLNGKRRKLKRQQQHVLQIYRILDDVNFGLKYFNCYVFWDRNASNTQFVYLCNLILINISFAWKKITRKGANNIIIQFIRIYKGFKLYRSINLFFLYGKYVYYISFRSHTAT